MPEQIIIGHPEIARLYQSGDTEDYAVEFHQEMQYIITLKVPTGVDYDVKLFDDTDWQTPIREGATDNQTEVITWECWRPGEYRIEVSSYTGASQEPFTLTVTEQPMEFYAPALLMGKPITAAIIYHDDEVAARQLSIILRKVKPQKASEGVAFATRLVRQTDLATADFSDVHVIVVCEDTLWGGDQALIDKVTLSKRPLFLVGLGGFLLMQYVALTGRLDLDLSDGATVVNLPVPVPYPLGLAAGQRVTFFGKPYRRYGMPSITGDLLRDGNVATAFKFSQHAYWGYPTPPSYVVAWQYWGFMVDVIRGLVRGV